MQELQSLECTPGRIGELIIQDIGMTTRLLQLVNSPFFGLSRTISDPVHAARLVGLDILKGLIITSQAFSQFEGTKVSYLSISELTKHSMLAGRTAAKILQDNHGSRAELDDAFTAGLLHDIGKLLLTRILRDEYNEVIEQSREEKQVFWQKEQETLHATHAELGAYLLGLWRLPNVVVEAVARHHVPGGVKRRCPPGGGCRARGRHHDLRHGRSGDQLPTGEVDSAYLAEAGVTVDFAACKEFIAGIKNKAQASS
jgi:putative nucleotidyltransferase with HDIG domain